MRGFRWETDGAGLVQPIEANTSGQPHIDLAVLRLNRETWTVSFRIVRSVAAATPIAPAATQKYGATDVWEWPVATIRVTSSTASGLPSIGAADVTTLDYHLAQPPMTGNSGRRSPAAWGAVWTDYDTTKTFVGHGGMWHLGGENGARTRIARPPDGQHPEGSSGSAVTGTSSSTARCSPPPERTGLPEPTSRFAPFPPRFGRPVT
ncbi:hypothetical protein [Actinoplanes xinjiangensis]|uniref:hypothetical protein n=1 Tax=Actinoplanes xinjiangensis TaxID=512350 RepID=UPI003424860C